jgi:ribosomal protein S18 acetylase RimI-like enzyme
VLRIREASGEADHDIARQLFTEYAAALGFDLGFQHFREEVGALPGAYGAPEGCILLAERDGAPCGCVALRPLHGDACEMKRLYVHPGSRGLGVGRALAAAVIGAARDRGYRRMRLDTLASMVEAIGLYESLGFREIGAYRHNPLDGARFFELDLMHGP